MVASCRQTTQQAWGSVDHSCFVMDTESQKLLVQPTGNRSSCGESFSARRPARRRRFSRREMLLLTAQGLAFLCLMFVVLAN